MFFMIGTWPGSKNLGFHNGYEITVTYNSLVIFFIPVFKFSKRYVAERCGRVYELDPEIGKAIERGEEPEFSFDREYTFSINKCRYCGFSTTDMTFEYCPKCGRELIKE